MQGSDVRHALTYQRPFPWNFKSSVELEFYLNCEGLMYFEKPSQNRYPCEVLNNINEQNIKLKICTESSPFLERICTNSFYTLHVYN